MLNIRKYLFETNSSSVHSLTMCDESDYQAWLNGDKWFHVNNGKFYDKAQLKVFMKMQALLDDHFEYDWKNNIFTYNGQTYSIKERLQIAEQFYEDISDDEANELYEQYLNDEPFEVPISYNDYDNLMDYETYEETFTSKSGDKIVAFGYYGMDN